LAGQRLPRAFELAGQGVAARQRIVARLDRRDALDDEPLLRSSLFGAVQLGGAALHASGQLGDVLVAIPPP
jgi:hypothetical protein